MEPLIIKSKSRTMLKSVLWGTSFILLGLAMEAGMIALIVTEGFSVIWVFGMLLFTLFIWAGITCLHWRKYPLELLADDKGIHYFEFDSRVGFGKHEIIIPWESVTAVTQFTDEDFDPEDAEYEALAIHTSAETDDPAIIWLDDTKITSERINDIVSKLNELRGYYSKCQKAEGL